MKYRPFDQIVQCNFRMKRSMRLRIEKAAKTNGVSVNDELKRRLEESFDYVPLLEQIRNLTGLK